METEKIKAVKKYGKQAQGKKELIDYLAGKHLTLKQSALGKCYDWMGYYADGQVDCNISNCILYPYMPYRKGEKRILRKMTKVQKEKIVLNLREKKQSNTPVMHYNA